MADILNTIGELIGLASSTGNVSEETFLGTALQEAIGALEGRYNVDPFLHESKGDEYEKMFSEIGENFGTLFAELNKIRSSFLPFELAKEVPTVEGENLNFNEIVNSESVLESYENAFFRMLGMPSSANIQDNVRLTYVTASGAKKKTGLNKEQYTAGRLDVRQLGKNSRPEVLGDEIYSLSKASDPFSKLSDLGLQQLDLLREILLDLKNLKNIKNKATKDAGELSRGIYTKTVEATKEESDLTERSKESLKSWTEHFGEGSTLSEDEVNELAVPMILRNIFIETLRLLEPTIRVPAEIISEIIFDSEVLGKKDISVRRLDLSENFWKYHYLLFPPIQDERIEKCINESEKIVAEPFLPKALRVINSKKMKPTLLEAVIRIRLDVISGTHVTYPRNGSQAPTSIGLASKSMTYEGTRDQLGLLEALLITRLFSSLYGMALDIKSKVKSMHVVQVKTGRKTKDEKKSDAQANAHVDGNVKSEEQRQFELIKTIEDSIFLLLGENASPEVLDLQAGTVRSSAIKEAHLMSAVLAAIDVPRRWAVSKIDNINSRNIRAADKADKAREGIGSKLGVSKGIGSIDVLVFIIAFFSVPVDVLISLLNQQQFAYMKSEFPKGFFDGFQLELNMGDAVQKISDAAFDGYELVRFIISSEGVELFVYND
jgi:hypothetical protein